jgi:hypothetical protein
MAFCTNCGSKLDDGVAFCPSCGTKVEEINAQEIPAQEIPAQEIPTQPIPAQEIPVGTAPITAEPRDKKSLIFAIIALSCGIASIVFFWFGFLFMGFFPIALGIAGIIFAILSKKKSKDVKATVGLITSIIGLALSVIASIIIIAAMGAGGSYAKNHKDEIKDWGEQFASEFAGDIEDDIKDGFDIDDDADDVDDDDDDVDSDAEPFYAIGDTVKCEDGITIEALKGGVIDDYGEYYKPAKGTKYVYFRVKVTNDAKKSKSITAFNFNAYVDDEQIDSAYTVGNDDYKLLSADIAPGKKATGDLLYQVPKDANRIQIIYKYYDEDSEEELVTFEMPV